MRGLAYVIATVLAIAEFVTPKSAWARFWQKVSGHKV